MGTTQVKAYVVISANGRIEPFNYELPEIGPERLDIKVEYCGLCHSDLSMLNNEWNATQYPFVPGHEVVGPGDLSKALKSVTG